MRIAVVGAGVMGASTAYFLARAGCEVHVFEAALSAARGVTGYAFGWVNMINGDPDCLEAYSLRAKAVAAYEALISEIPELLPELRRGSLVWRETPAATQALAERHSASSKLRLIVPNEAAKLEPCLQCVPPLAVFSPDDLAINPALLTETLLARAAALGAVLHFGSKVQRLLCESGAVRGVRTCEGTFVADRVVLTTGVQTDDLLESYAAPLGVSAAPVLLLRYGAQARFLQHVVSCPELEVRQAGHGEVLVVEDFLPGCEDGNFSAVRQRVERAMETCFAGQGPLNFLDATVGRRPWFEDSLPRCGFMSGVRGLYTVVGHPGVILAPWLGRMAAQELMA